MSDEKEFSNVEASRQSFRPNNIQDPSSEKFYSSIYTNRSNDTNNYQYPNQTREDPSINSECVSIEDKYLRHSRGNFDLIPSAYRSDITNFDRLSNYSGIGLCLFNLFSFVKFYPEVFITEHKNFILKPSLILLGIFILSRYKVDMLYRDSYRYLRETNSEESINALIDRYYMENLKSIQVAEQQREMESQAQANERI